MCLLIHELIRVIKKGPWENQHSLVHNLLPLVNFHGNEINKPLKYLSSRSYFQENSNVPKLVDQMGINIAVPLTYTPPFFFF